MAEAWKTEGYKIFKLDMEKQKVTFHRNQDGMSHIKIPKCLTQNKIPDEAKNEVEHYLDYIIKKYALK